MTLEGYLVIKKANRGWNNLTARFSKTNPSLDSGEISVKIECELPNELFERPQLKFKIDIPKGAVPQKEITADVRGNIQELIQQNLGITVTLVSEEKTE